MVCIDIGKIFPNLRIHRHKNFEMHLIEIELNVAFQTLIKDLHN